jgi:hypothetical protein
MTINISTVKQQRPTNVGSGISIIAKQYESLLNSEQACYKYSNRVIYTDFRNKDLTGYYYGNAPWYYPPYEDDSNWVAQVTKLPYRPNSPLPGSNVNLVTSVPVNPVSAGVPNLTLYIEGCNLQFFIQIERVTVDSSTGAITYTGDGSRYSQILVGAYNAGSPWLSTYSNFEVRIGLPENTTSEDLLLIDIYTRGSDEDESSPGFLSTIALWESQFSNFPDGNF